MSSKPHQQQPPSPKATSSVQVVVRLRPLNEKEKKHGTLPVVSASTNEKSVTVIKGQGSRQVKTSYKFDNVFTAFSSQEEVFEATLQPVIRDVLQGFESTVFAYGQTGTGKTHTMEGDLSDPELHGVIPRSASAIFQALDSPQYVEKCLYVSFLEIYNEDLCDLLASPNKKAKLDIMVGKNGPFCRGLSETKVESAEEVLALMRKAQNNRQVGETNMNEQSSRSHCIFTLKVQAKRSVSDGSILEVSGKLHCVDLAGSECAKSADLEHGVGDQQASRERERMNINRSLLTLGRVVSMLKDQSQGKNCSKNVRIPYRDSKLTRILQESLGGRCKTCLIATVSPSVTAIEESMSTLNYAQAANGIINKPVTSSLMTAFGGSSMPVPTTLGREDKTGTVDGWHEMECRLQYMQSQVEEAQQALARKHLQQQELMEKSESAENARVAALSQLEESERGKKVMEKEIEEHVTVNQQLSNRLTKTEQTMRETAAILKATQATESRLTQEAQDLIAKLRKSTEVGDAMHQALRQNREHEVARRGATRSFQESILRLLTWTTSCLDSMSEGGKKQNDFLLDSSEKLVNEQNTLMDNQQFVVDEINKSIKSAMVSLMGHMTGNAGITQAYNETVADIVESTDALRELGTMYLKETKTACEVLRERLASSAATLHQMEHTYAISSERMLETLSQEVLKSKENLSKMVVSMTATLAHAHDERNNSRKALSDMVQDWKDSSLQTTKNIAQTSKEHGAYVQSLLEMLAAEAKRHAEVSTVLSEQQYFLQQQSSFHIGKLGDQKKLLNSQKESINTSGQISHDLCNLMMSNIISGVQDLVKKELSAIREHNNKCSKSFVSSNLELLQSNEGMLGSAKELFDNLGTSNNVLQGHSVLLREMDERTFEGLSSTQAALEIIDKDCQSHETTVAASAKKINGFSVKSAEADLVEAEEMTQSMKAQVDKCGDLLANRILEQTRAGAEKLAKVSGESFSLTKESLVDATATFVSTYVEDKATAFHSTAIALMEQVDTKTDCGRETISNIAQSHNACLEATSQSMEQQTKQLSSGFALHSKSILKHRDGLLENCDDNKKIMNENLTICREHTYSMKNSVTDFSVNVLKADEEPIPVGERHVLSFSNELSSTPADHIILQGLENNVPQDSTHSNITLDENENVFDSTVNEFDDTPSQDTTAVSSHSRILKEDTNTERRSSILDGPGEINKRRSLARGLSQDESTTSRAKRVRTKR